jgi:hypothetical protein
LGPEGGFGVVYPGSGDEHQDVAVKKLKLEAHEAAHRELRIAEEFIGRTFRHVLPFLDAGQDAESGFYFVVMPRAEKSLEDELQSGRTWEDVDAAGILLEIAEGLSEVPDVVHRDLKPGNILLHEERWKVADFGIARFVEESTSLRTLKECLSPRYAAPEQWLYERSSNKTDVYALGCIGYALLTGHPPFPGPRGEEYREQHLHESPPQLEKHNVLLRSLLAIMLRKNPEIRPSLSRVVQLLKNIIDGTPKPGNGRGLSALARAGALVAEREALEEAKRNAEAANRAQRGSLAQEAKKILSRIVDTMFESIHDSAPAAVRRSSRGGTIAVIQLGHATLELNYLFYGTDIPEGSFPASGWDVVVGAKVTVKQEAPVYLWSSSLWYARVSLRDSYRWFEVSYFTNAFVMARPPFEPYALEDIAMADEAASPVMGMHQIAYGPKPIDDEDTAQFCERWAELLAKACEGKLGPPSHLPLK